MLFNLTFIQARVTEPSNFVMARRDGAARYMFFHFSSSIELTINGKTEIVNPGAVILYTPGTPQFFRPFNTRLIHDYVDFDVIDKELLEEIHFPINTVIYPRISTQITTTIEKMNQIMNSDLIGSQYENDTLFCNLLLTISRKMYRRRHKTSFATSEEIKNKVEKMRLDLFENPSGKTVASLAKEIGFSEPYFNKIYKIMFKVAPSKDLNTARLEYTKAELLEGKNPIDLCHDLCFANVEYFYNWFKKQTGKTPKEFIYKK